MSLRACQRKSGFSNEEWSSLIRTVGQHMANPTNRTGLEGIMKHKEAWEVWFDNYLDVEIGKQYWGILKGKRWAFSRDRDLIRKLMRTVVILIAQNKRKLLPRRLAAQEWLGGYGEHKLVEDKNLEKEKEECDVVEDEEDEEDEDNGNLQAQDETATTKINERLDDGEPGINIYSMTQISSLAQGVSPSLIAPHPPLIFSTRLASAKNSDISYKFVYTEDSPPLPLFLEKAHRKHQLERGLRISNLRVKIGNKTFTIDINSSERHWDWSVAMEITRKEDGPVEIVLTVSTALGP